MCPRLRRPKAQRDQTHIGLALDPHRVPVRSVSLCRRKFVIVRLSIRAHFRIGGLALGSVQSQKSSDCRWFICRSRNAKQSGEHASQRRGRS